MKIGLQVIVFTNKKELTSMLQVRNKIPIGETNALARLGNTRRFGTHEQLRNDSFCNHIYYYLFSGAGMIAEALVCLALNIYHEARNQPKLGQIAVAQVVVNRVNDSRYPNNICDVVYQGLHYESGHPIINKCQFSWYCDGKSDKPKDKEAYQYSMKIAKNVIMGDSFGYLEGATHYHTIDVAPSWASGKKFIVRINDHLFYRWE